jgi:hypothetical protein
VLLSLATDLIDGRVDATVANRVRWGGGRLSLAISLSHFPKLEPKLELHGSKCNADLSEGSLDALWSQTHQASESLALNIPSLVARDSPDDIGKEYWW